MDLEGIMEKEARYHLGTYQRFPAVFERGEGCYLFDSQGNSYLDLISGISVNLLGYGYLPLVRAIQEEVNNLIHVSNLFYSRPQVELAERLVEKSGFARVFFNNSGAEANEVALKMARFYGHRKHKGRYKYLSFYRSFHGRTFLTLALTGQEKFHQDLDPLPDGILFAPLNHLEEVEQVLDDKVCAIIVEPIQGEGGIYPSSMEFLRGLRQLCDQRDIILIFDEVQCGMGRTGSLFAFEHFGVRPDIVTLAKGLGGGLPLGAVLVNDKIVEITKKGDQGSTFGGNPICARSACVVVDKISEEEFLAEVREKGNYLGERLKQLAKQFSSLITEVRGLGLMWGIDLPSHARWLSQKLGEKRILVNAVSDHTVRFLPPLVIKKEEIDLLVENLEEILASSDWQ